MWFVLVLFFTSIGFSIGFPTPCFEPTFRLQVWSPYYSVRIYIFSTGNKFWNTGKINSSNIDKLDAFRVMICHNKFSFKMEENSLFSFRILSTWLHRRLKCLFIRSTLTTIRYYAFVYAVIVADVVRLFYLRTAQFVIRLRWDTWCNKNR